MLFNFNGIEAALFDMDGTLLDSMSYWRRINEEFLAARGLEAPGEIRADLRTLSNRVCASAYAGMPGVGMTREEILQEYQNRMRHYYQTEIVAKPGAAQYVRTLRARGLKTCVATGSPLSLATIALKKNSLYDEFDGVFSANELNMQKEEPFFYQYVASQLGVRPEACIMYEDALYAMKGARKAGMAVFAIEDPIQAEQFPGIAEIADVFVPDYAKFPVPD